MSIEELKSDAIKILDDPNTDLIWKQWALNFAKWYKAERQKRIDAKEPTSPDERAICVDNKGQRTDLKQR